DRQLADRQRRVAGLVERRAAVDGERAEFVARVHREHRAAEDERVAGRDDASAAERLRRARETEGRHAHSPAVEKLRAAEVEERARAAREHAAQVYVCVEAP